MGRPAEGYKLRWRGERRGWTVRFSLDKRYELSTGVRDRKAKAEADRKAREVYAEHVQGQRRKQRGPAPDSPLLERVSEWLEELPVRDVTRETYEGYSVHWVKTFSSVRQMTSSAIESYTARRLKQSKRKSVANELSALRRFATWLERSGHGSVDVPRLPDGLSGKAYKHRRRARAPELTPAEVRKVLAALPVWSDIHRFPIRARFTVQYETGLRTTTIDKLRAPDNYSKGALVLVLTDSDDKEAYGREVPLSLRARRALDSVVPSAGVIFGEHDYVRYLRPAADAALPAHKAAVFTWQHLRSARITHWLEQTSDLPGVMYLAGHKHASTTGKYVRASLRAAQNVVRKAR